MENTVIGIQIAKFRKAQGLTQDALAKAVSVSTQAVSRWECGGAPDVALLPAIADKLGISIDALFGREGGDGADMEQLALRWGSGINRDRLLTELNRLIWSAGVKYIGREVGISDISYLQNCQSEVHPGEITLVCSSFCIDDGIFFGVGAEDMAFSTVCPRPEKGYAAYFCENDDSRRFFSVLAKPGCLEIILYMLGRSEQLFASRTIAEGIGMEPAAVDDLLEEMKKINLTDSIEVLLPDGLTKIYQIRDDGSIVPLLYLVKAMLKGDAFYLKWNGRTKPLL